MKFYSEYYLALILFTTFFLSPKNIHAQITPDNTLGSEGSKINSIDESHDRIEGGARRGDNLFHSFQEFSIVEGFSADFANPEGIANIFSRVTGKNISEIFGELKVNGTANLFFLNPNGIIFGKNAKLNVNGSFLASTADNVEFDNGSQFSAVNPDESLLTIEIPIGLGFGSNTNTLNNDGQINVVGSGHTLNARAASSVVRSEAPNSLSVPPSENLVLIAHEINFDGGIAISSSGNIEIGSILNGYVKFDSNINQQEIWSFDYGDVETFGDINFINRSLLDVSSVPDNLQLGGGKITVRGSNILSKDGSVILNQNFGDNDAASININASESLRISGTDPIANILGGIRTEAISRGNGSNIEISTPLFSIFNGGSVQSFTYSIFPETVSGNINLNILDLQVLNSSPLSAISVSNISTFTFGSSKAGNLSVNSNTIVLEDGGAIASSGFFGAVGEISINATEYIRINGFQPTTFGPSNIASVNSSSPSPGTIKIITPDLSIQNGGNISTSTFSDGSAGNISIETDNLQIEGKISQSIIPEAQTPSNISSSTTQFNRAFIELLPENLDSQTFVGSSLEGNSGSIEITTGSLDLSDNGQITVLNSGIGDGGKLNIIAESIILNDGGEISASTVSGEGGNINLDSENLELLKQSQITASAGGEGNGGNIEINSDTILGLNNSDITANAVEGNGGNISINSDFILGLESRSQLTPFNDITASSELGIDGTVTINSPENNSEEDVLISALEVGIYTGQELFPDGCNNRDGGGMKIAHLNGGSPESPDNFYDDEEPSLSSEFKSVNPNPVESAVGNELPPLWSEGDPVIEGNMIQTNSDGSVFLVAVDQEKTAESMICKSGSSRIER